jgi:hypothetical protein
MFSAVARIECGPVRTDGGGGGHEALASVFVARTGSERKERGAGAGVTKPHIDQSSERPRATYCGSGSGSTPPRSASRMCRGLAAGAT